MITRVDDVLDILVRGSVSSCPIFFRDLSDQPSTWTDTFFLHPQRTPRKAPHTPRYHRFESMMRFVTTGFDNVWMCIDGTVGSDYSSIYPATTLCLHKLKLSTNKSRVGVKHVDFLGNVIPQGSIQPKDDKVTALTRMSTPTYIKQLRRLLGGPSSSLS